MSLVLQPDWPSYVNRSGQLCLKAAIVCLGFTLNVQVLWQTSRDYSGLVLAFVACTLIAGLVIGRLMKVDEDQSRLLSTGTAICGGTAIVTLAPIVRARPAVGGHLYRDRLHPERHRDPAAALGWVSTSR